MDRIQVLNQIQSEAKSAVLNAFTANGQALVRMATGTGKTDLAMKVIKDRLDADPNVKALIVVPFIDIVKQTIYRAAKYGIAAGEYSSEVKDLSKRLTVATVQTISRKGNLFKIDRNMFGYIVYDEAHHAPAQTWKRVKEYFQVDGSLGLTATPHRPDGEKLEPIFGNIVGPDISFKKALELGVISQGVSRVILTNSVLYGVVGENGEYKAKELDKLVVSVDRNETCWRSYVIYGQGAMRELGLPFKTICFCVNVKHAMLMAEFFRSKGISAAFMVADRRFMSAEERSRIFSTFRDTYDIEVLCVVDTIGEGIDIPDAMCAIMLRPTRSNIKYQQQVGRVSRKTDTKKFFVVLDYVDNTRREWTCYTYSNLEERKVMKNEVITEFVTEKDPVRIEQRVDDLMASVERFEERIRRVWTDESLIEDAKKYETRTKWSVGSSGAYTAARKRGPAFFEKCCAHMKQVKCWTDEELIEDAKKYELRSGWQKLSGSAYRAALRRSPAFFEKCCAHMKQPFVIWTDDAILKSALNYATKAAWIKQDPKAMAAAKQRGPDFFNRCTAHMSPILKSWTDESLIEDAKKYETRTGWSVGSNGAYQMARKRGPAFFEKCCAHMKQLFTVWTDDAILEDAKKHKTRKSWYQSSSASDAAKKRGEDFFNRCTAHMERAVRQPWTDEELIEDAKKYETRGEWADKSESAYKASLRKGEDFFEKCCAHMKVARRTWTDESLIEDAKKYETRVAWMNNSSGYQMARKRGPAFFEKCCTHMISLKKKR